jgi:hypothetical protein
MMLHTEVFDRRRFHNAPHSLKPMPVVKPMPVPNPKTVKIKSQSLDFALKFPQFPLLLLLV